MGGGGGKLVRITSMSNRKETIDQLRALCSQSQEVMFERVNLAASLFADAAWVESIGGKEPAMSYVGQFFTDLYGAIELYQLLEVLEEFPTVDEWRAYDFNLQRLWWNGVQGKRLERTRAERKNIDLEHKRAKQREWSQARKERARRTERTRAVPERTSRASLTLDRDHITIALPKDLAETIHDVIQSHPESVTVWNELVKMMEGTRKFFAIRN